MEDEASPSALKTPAEPARDEIPAALGIGTCTMRQETGDWEWPRTMDSEEYPQS